MGIKDWFANRSGVSVSQYKMVTESTSGFLSWNGKLYHSDLVRAAIRPKATAVGKAVGKHVRKNEQGTKVNPDVYMKFLLEEPNPYMTGQLMQEKLVTHLELNNNAFAFINRDENGMPTEIYPLTPVSTEAVVDARGRLYLRFTLRDGRMVTFQYSDLIHLRKDYNENDIFGDPNTQALSSLMDVVGTTDQGVVKAIKNSNIIRWLLKFNNTLRPEDLKANSKKFVEDYLSVESDTVGVAATDAKAEAVQVEPKSYVPNEKQMDRTSERILSFFNTNSNIVQGDYTEDQWIAFYESAIEPIIVQMSKEFTRKLFTRRERGHGNKILFESSNLSFASMSTKLQLVEYVDRGIMTPNEVREALNMEPVEGGDDMVRRLDTAKIEE